MRVYLVQHGKAFSKVENPNRPLTEVGSNESFTMANYLSRVLKKNVSSIVHSGKMRAKQTAVIFGEHLKPSIGIKDGDGLNPTSDPSIWMIRLRKITHDIMLIGHLPHLLKLGTLLLTDDERGSFINFQNSGVVCLEKKDNAWAINWIITPENID